MKLIEIIELPEGDRPIQDWESHCKEIEIKNEELKKNAPLIEVQGWEAREIFTWGVNEGKPSSSIDKITNYLQASMLGLDFADMPQDDSEVKLLSKQSNQPVYFLVKKALFQEKASADLIPLPPKPTAKSGKQIVLDLNPKIIGVCKNGGYRIFYSAKNETGEKYEYISYGFDNKVIKIQVAPYEIEGVIEVTKTYKAHEYRIFPNRIEIWEREYSESQLYYNGSKYHSPVSYSDDSGYSGEVGLAADGFLSPGYD